VDGGIFEFMAGWKAAFLKVLQFWKILGGKIKELIWSNCQLHVGQLGKYIDVNPRRILVRDS
jgi:hypothetical protein